MDQRPGCGWRGCHDDLAEYAENLAGIAAKRAIFQAAVGQIQPILLRDAIVLQMMLLRDAYRNG